jgi:TolB-like protein
MAETIEAFALVATPPITSPVSGLRRVAGFGYGALAKPQTRNWILIATLVVVAIVLAVVATLTLRVNNAVAGDRSIAILPFENRSQNKDDSEYGDWLSELISGLLGKARDLRVISQTSASVFRGKAVALPEIAKQLGVTMIVEGSVRSEGGNIVISAQLFNAATDTQVWAEIYERKTENALGVQSEVAAKVAAAVAKVLGVAISADEQQALTPTTKPEAYEAYRAALKLYRTSTETNVRSAQRLLSQAVDMDSGFAAAWALLARVHSFLYFNRTDATEGRRAAAEQALNEALRLKPELAEVLLADAYYEYWVKRDYEGARIKFEKLSEKWPSNADVLAALGSITRRQGRWDESKSYFERAVTIDPLHAGRRLKAAELNFAMRDMAGALRQLDDSLQHWPAAPDSLPFIAKKALIYQALGRLDEAGTLLKGFAPQPDGELVQPIVYQALLNRRYDDAIHLLEGLLKRDQAEGSVGRASIDLNIYLGDLRRLAGDAAGAKSTYEAALDKLRVELAQQPENADLDSYLALVYSGLGDRAAATKYAALAVNTVPIAKDALSGAYYLDVQARVWARFGDRNAAIPAIEQLMKLPAPLPLTPALLRLDPDFDNLRPDARFNALLNDVR